MIKHRFPTLFGNVFFLKVDDLIWTFFLLHLECLVFKSLVDLRTFSTPFVMSPFQRFENFLTLMLSDVNLDHHQCLVFSFLTYNITSDLWFAITSQKMPQSQKCPKVWRKFPLKRTKRFLKQRIWDITFHFLLGSNVAKLCQEQKEH